VSQCLYFAEVFGYTKIGIADDPWKRVRELQTGCPERIALRGVFEPEGTSAYEMERVMHTILAPFQSSGEWFRAEPHMIGRVHKLAHCYLERPDVLARWMRKFYAKQGKGSKADSPENPNWESWQEAAQQERAEAKVGATVAAGTIVPIGGVG
jgi:hypothetical protein